MLDAIFERALDAILIADDEGRYVKVNPAAERLTGYTSEELGRMTIFDITPAPTKEQGLAMWREFIRRGRLSGEYPMAHKDGSTVEVEFQAVASIKPGLHLSIVRDVTTRKRAERQLRRLVSLQEATAAMSAAVDPRRVADVVLAAAVSAFDAQAGHVMVLVDDERWELLATVGIPPARVEHWLELDRAHGGSPSVVEGRPRLSLAGPWMLREAFERGGPPRVEQLAEGSMAPARPAAFAGLGNAMTCLTLAVGGALVGGLYLFWSERRGWADDEPAFATMLAELCGQALDRARLFTAERVARERAVASERSMLEAQQQLQEVALERAVVEERERRRLTEALHDGVTQYLALAKITLEPLQQRLQGDDGAAITKATRLISQAIGETRSLSFQLSPPMLYDLGLAAALSWFAETLEQDTGLRVEIVDAGFDPRLDDVTASVVYRTVRELLMNVAKHAKSATATVSLVSRGAELEIVVADRGAGFDPTHVPHGGFGLMSVSEQIGRLGGVVEVEAAPDAGVRISVRLPRARTATLPA